MMADHVFIALLVLIMAPVTTSSLANMTRTLLLVDDHDLFYRAGLRRELEPLRRPTPGVAALASDMPWESLLGYVSVQEVDGNLMMWYQSYVADLDKGINGTGCFVAVAYSSDRGSSWTKPRLSVLKTASGGKTNVVFAPSPSFYFGSVLHEPNAPAHARFKMVFWDLQLGTGPDPSNNVTQVPGLYTALSPDGLNWTQQEPLGQPKVVGGYGDPGAVSYQGAEPNKHPDAQGHWQTELSESDAMNLVYDPKMKEYKVYHKTWIDGVDGTSFWKRAVMVHSSADFENWEPNPGKLCVYPDEFDGDNSYLPNHDRTGTELHAGPAFYHADADVYLMLVQHLDWQSKPMPGNLNCELAVSRGDGTEWTRPFRSRMGFPKFLDVNPEAGQFDSGTLWTNPQFVDGPAGSDTQRLFYGAYQSWGQSNYTQDGHQTGVGMAEMTTDRFAFVTNLNVSYPGQLTTKPIAIGTGGGAAGCKITTNADTRLAGSEVRLELLSASGYRLRGWESSAPMSNVSGVSLPGLWGQQRSPELPSDEAEVMVRAHLKGGAKLYAISLVCG